MSIWAIADLHLCFSTPNKTMEIFGEHWLNYTDKLEKNWQNLVKPQDLVLIPGDISWAMNIQDALVDLNWIHNLPGTKLIIKGNHDFWWPSKTKLKSHLPSSIHFLQNDAFTWNNAIIAGSRLWDTEEFSFPNTCQDKEKMKKIYERELIRLEMSLMQTSLPQMDKEPFKICMTHFPPIGLDLKDSKASILLEKYKVNICIFGHLHNMPQNTTPFGVKNNVYYKLVSADFINFSPLLII